MLYNIVLFFHILGAVLIFMAIGLLFTAMISMLHAKDVKGIRQWSSLAIKLDILFPISTILTLASAFYLVFSAWGWGYAWINVSVAALIGNSILGILFNLMRLKGIGEAANRETENVPSSALLNKVRDRILWTAISIMTLVTIGILFLMVMKLETAGSLMAMGIAVAAGFLLAKFILRTVKNETPKDALISPEK
ncbi:hypothetical protein ACSFXN_16000 [Planococcus sp. 1R117A]|uniref:hypothetical protein n=1 Tax=Planococcus sp. 1R117A TaxID=3447020 RepID=UPI003EDBF7EE